MELSLHSTLKETIEEYTGLTPMAFFTILALTVGAYRLVCGMFVFPEEKDSKKPIDQQQQQPMTSQPFFPITDPVQLGDVSEEQLRAYDGSDPNKPLLMAIKGQIYDVSRSRMFYGPGGPYALFAGRDASRALALMSFDPNDLTGNTEGLGPSELEVLNDWELKFMEKYVKVGQLITEKTRVEDTRSEERTNGNSEARRETPL